MLSAQRTRGDDTTLPILDKGKTETGRKTYAAKSVRTRTLIDRCITPFAYTYSCGDTGRHTVVVEAVEDADTKYGYPNFLDDKNRAPPEDVGGTVGFAESY